MKLVPFAVSGLAAIAWFGVASVHSQAAGGGRSPLYGASAGTIVFDHAGPGHRGRACSSCHLPPMAAGRPDRPPAAAVQSAPGSAQPTPPARSGAELKSPEASCAPCHAELLDRAQARPERCGFCHRGFQGAPLPSLPRAAARIHFTHARHGALPCAGCHRQSEGATSPALPDMQSCLNCHRGPRALACNGCHLADASGRLRRQFPDAQLIPRGALLGMAHDADFLVRHRWLAADHANVCASCHTESECSACHDGRRRPRSVHPNDYLSLHAQDSQRNASRCGSCHENASFCLACHARLGISQISAPDLKTPRRFHPPSAQWIRGPTLHAREAQRSLASCVSCHAEQDCVECHAARGIGVGLRSPHPASFVADCARALRQDSRACLRCHQSSDAALRACR